MHGMHGMHAIIYRPDGSAALIQDCLFEVNERSKVKKSVMYFRAIREHSLVGLRHPRMRLINGRVSKDKREIQTSSEYVPISMYLDHTHHAIEQA
jgi:hypothetical protein